MDPAETRRADAQLSRTLLRQIRLGVDSALPRRRPIGAQLVHDQDFNQRPSPPRIHVRLLYGAFWPAAPRNFFRADGKAGNLRLRL